VSGYRQKLGRWGEAAGAAYLASQGYRILERNARTPYGELDLVACQETPEGRVIVFIEVKTRSSDRFGFPEASVTPRKQAHLQAAAQAYLTAHPELDGPCRIDVLAILRAGRDGKTEILHFQDAVRD
jgi:putative endonuclease